MSRRLSRLIVTLGVACAALVAMASVASAAPVAITGAPLTVYVGEQGQLQGFLSGQEDGVYFAPSEQEGDAGFFLAFPAAGAGPTELKEHVWGFNGSAGPFGLDPFINTAQDPVTGSGSAADPFTQLTEYKTEGGVDGVYVEQITTYVNGTTEFKVQWVVTNETGVPVNFRAFAAADFYFEGSDRGTGVFTAGPPRFIGGTNVDSGRSGGFVEVNGGASPPWTHYQALTWPDVWGVIENAAAPVPSGFDDTVNPNDEDNAGGVEWDQYRETPLPDGASATFELIARNGVPAALQLNPTNAGAPQGVPIGITATALDSNGAPYAGRILRHTITGANPGTGALTLNSLGQGVITDPGANAGGDTIAAFVDFNNNGVREAFEPQASALATFIDGLGPRCKVKVKGDRPSDKGGAGSTLVISINCSEASTVTVSATLIAPAPAAKGSSAAARRQLKGKGKRRIKLPKTKAKVAAGANIPIGIKVPKGIARQYAGKKLTLKVVATVKDGAGNVTKAKKSGKVRISAAKKQGKGAGGR